MEVIGVETLRGARRLACWLAWLAIATPYPTGAAGTQVRTDAAAEGSHGLRVSFGPDCQATQSLVLDADDGPLDGSYRACRTITAAAVAVEGAEATLEAGEAIVLGNGFEVAAGSTLSLLLDRGLFGGPTYVEDSSPIAESGYTARFSARLDGLVLAPGERIDALVAYSVAAETLFHLLIEPAAGGGFQLALEARQDGGGLVQTPPGQEVAVPAGWNIVDLEWSAGNGDGRLLVGLNGGALAGLTGLDNGAALIETVRWGGVDGALFSSSGWIELDTYSSTR